VRDKIKKIPERKFKRKEVSFKNKEVFCTYLEQKTHHVEACISGAERRWLPLLREVAEHEKRRG